MRAVRFNSKPTPAEALGRGLCDVRSPRLRRRALRIGGTRTTEDAVAVPRVVHDFAITGRRTDCRAARYLDVRVSRWKLGGEDEADLRHIDCAEPEDLAVDPTGLVIAVSSQFLMPSPVVLRVFCTITDGA